MKGLIVLIILSFSLGSFAQLTEEQSFEYVEVIAKGLRRDLWVQSHEDVHSEVRLSTYSELDEHTDGLTNSEYEVPLSESEVSEIYNCAERANCLVFHIRVSSSYYSGYGTSSHFVLLDTKSVSREIISHVTYSE